MECFEAIIGPETIRAKKTGTSLNQAYKCPYCSKLHLERFIVGQAVTTPYGKGILVHGKSGRYLIRLTAGVSRYFYASQLK